MDDMISNLITHHFWPTMLAGGAISVSLVAIFRHRPNNEPETIELSDSGTPMITLPPVRVTPEPYESKPSPKPEVPQSKPTTSTPSTPKSTAMTHQEKPVPTVEKTEDWKEEALNRLKALETSNAVNAKVLNLLMPSLYAFAVGDKSAPRLLVLHGAPGGGKSHLASLLAKTVAKKVEQMNVGSLKSDHVGGTSKKMNQVFQDGHDLGCAAIIIDEADVLLPNRVAGGKAETMTREAVAEILTWTDGSRGSTGRLLVILTSNSLEYDPAVLQRADHILEIEPPNQDEMVHIVSNILTKHDMYHYRLEKWLASMMDGLSPRDAEKVICEGRRQFLMGNRNFVAHMKESLEARKRQLNPSMEPVTFDQVHLPEETKLEVRSAIIALTEKAKLQQLNIRAMARPILFVGAPGGGKTMLARAIATETKGVFIDADISQLKGEFLGQSAGKIKEAFQRARGRGAGVVFIDEIDCLAPSRKDSTGESMTKEVIGTLLVELDGLQSNRPNQPLVVAASNHPELIDPGILSRFHVIEIPLPDFTSRQAMVYDLAKGHGLHGKENTELLTRLARLTEGESGRKLRNIMDQTHRRWLMRVLKAGKKLPLDSSDFPALGFDETRVAA